MCEVIHVQAAFQKARKFDAPAHGFDPVPDDEMAVLDAGEAIVRLAAQVGSYARLQSILRTYAAIAGEEV